MVSVNCLMSDEELKLKTSVFESFFIDLVDNNLFLCPSINWLINKSVKRLNSLVVSVGR